jgi:hypothetical protein
VENVKADVLANFETDINGKVENVFFLTFIDLVFCVAITEVGIS